MNTEETGKLCETVVALIRYSKTPNLDAFTERGLIEVLAPIYSPKMRRRDVVHVVLKAYLQMLEEKRFEMPYRGDMHTILMKLLFAPIDDHWMFHPERLSDEAAVPVKDFYWDIVKHMLSAIMVCRVDWCRHQVFPERCENSQN